MNDCGLQYAEDRIRLTPPPGILSANNLFVGAFFIDLVKISKTFKLFQSNLDFGVSMDIIQRGYQFTAGVAKGSWDASLPLSPLRFRPFYYAVSLKGECLNQLSDFPLPFSSNLFFSYACQGVYYGTPLALKGATLVRYVHGKEWKAIEKIETTYKTVLISLCIISAAWGLRKASLENKPFEMTHAAGLLLGGSLETLASYKVINEKTSRPILNKLWWTSIALSFVEGKGLSGGMSLLYNRFTSTLSFYMYGLIAELPVIGVLTLYLAVAFRTGLITIHPILDRLSQVDLDADGARESYKQRIIAETCKRQEFAALSQEKRDQALQLIRNCFDTGVVDRALALCSNRAFQDQCQQICLQPFGTDYKKVAKTLLEIPEVVTLKVAFEAQAIHAPALFPSLQLPAAIEETRAIVEPRDNALIAECDSSMMEYTIARLFYRFSFGEKSTEEIPSFFTPQTRAYIFQMRSAGIGQNRSSSKWIQENLIDSLEHYNETTVPQEHQEFVNLFRHNIHGEIREGIIITKVWPELNNPPLIG